MRPFSGALLLFHTRGLGTMPSYRSLKRARQLRWRAGFGAAIGIAAVPVLNVNAPAAELQACPSFIAARHGACRHSSVFVRWGAKMIGRTFALLCLGLLTAWADRPDGVVVPYNHPANPYARSAPPLVVPRILAPNVEDVTPEPAREESRPPREQQRSSPGAGAPAHQHQH